MSARVTLRAGVLSRRARVRLSSLTEAEIDLLEVLSEGLSCTGIVRLAGDLFGRGRDERFMYGDPLGFVAWLLQDLAERGFLKYRTDVRSETADDARDIRLTPAGWAAMGYPRMHAEVGFRSRLREVSRADSSDYRNYETVAEVLGETTRHMWWEHPADAPLRRPHRRSEVHCD